MTFRLSLFFAVSLLMSCRQDNPSDALMSQLTDAESITGKAEYLNTPFVTAGDRLYMVGHQDGSFPDLGWHVTGEMGGIWDHPIKLMDGFTLAVEEAGKANAWCLNNATTFTNYPFANRHTFLSPSGDLEIDRVQFVPDGIEGLVVEYTLSNNGQEGGEYTLNFTGLVDLTPVWLAERINITDGADEATWDDALGAYIAKDAANDWFTVFGTDAESTPATTSPACKTERKGKGIDASISNKVAIAAGEEVTVTYYIAGSYLSKEKAVATYDELKKNSGEFLAKKIQRYTKIDELSKVTIPDKDIETMYRWVKYNTDWLIRDVENQGRGLSAGLPDYPWWFGADNCYTLQGLLATGQHEEVMSTIDLVAKLSAELNGNGRIIHETSTNGVTYNPGNLNETPQFIYLLWKAYEWTGDKTFLKKYYPEVKKGLEWITSQDKDNNGHPDGAGLMEIHGLHSEMVDVVVYLQQAWEAAAAMAAEMGEADLSAQYQAKADKLRSQINTEWWVPEFGSFADFRSTKAEALQLIDAAMVRADTINKPWATEELKKTKEMVSTQGNSGVRPYVVHHNWVVNTPMEMGLADAGKAETALATGRKYRSRFGMYVTGMDRDESTDASSKWKAFSYVGAVMTLPTGVQAVSEARYGHPDESLSYLKNLHNSFGYALPGSIYEVSPDYGMVVQAWTIYSVAVPIVNHFFGIQPQAHKKEVVIRPDMPSHWHNASIEDVVIGSNKLSFSKETSGTTTTYSFKQKADWKISLQIPASGVASLIINGQKQDLKSGEALLDLKLSGLEGKVEVVR